MTAARAQSGRSATAEELEWTQKLVAKLVALKAWRERLESLDLAGADPGSLTRDVDAAWDLCDMIDALIEGLEGPWNWWGNVDLT